MARRIAYLDYARGFAVFTMFLQHCMLVHEYNHGDTTPLELVFVLLGTAPAAPVFLLLMGVFLAQSRAPLPVVLKRGAVLIALGYLLNLLRFTLPLLLSGETEFLPGESPLEHLFAVDILHAAGLSFIIGGVLKRYCPKWAWAAAALVVILVSPFLWRTEPLPSPLNLLWGAAPQVYFPLFPWLFYPLAGMLISDDIANGSLFSRSTRLVVGLIGGLAASCLLLLIAPVGDYVRAGPGVHLGILAFIVLWLLGLYRLERTRFSDSRVAATLSFWSINVTSIYCIQWLLFGWSILLFDAGQQPDYRAALIGLGVLVITHSLVKSERVRSVFP